ncbi:uncharacterized protein LOC5512975 [Nematostella vectensis]|uniref:uncharacterized protein LOC5512975 n=1 Tax=Nematostella vectensis TaxID=45351 RepID=UPI0020775802|nr:uncharacterized protein LOC5512975 [Nematostella vectensis]
MPNEKTNIALVFALVWFACFSWFVFPVDGDSDVNQTVTPYAWNFDGDLNEHGMTINREIRYDSPDGTKGVCFQDGGYADLGNLGDCLSNPHNCQISFSALIKIKEQSNHYLFAKSRGRDTDTGVWIRASASEIKVYVVTSSKVCYKTISTKRHDRWFFMSFVWSPNIIKVFLDGGRVDKVSVCLNKSDEISTKAVPYRLSAACFDQIRLWTSEVDEGTLNAPWRKITDNGGSTEVTLTLDFLNPSQGDGALKQQLKDNLNIIDALVLRSDNSSTKKDVRINFRDRSWSFPLKIKTLLEEGILLGSKGSIAGCQADDDHFFCEIPQFVSVEPEPSSSTSTTSVNVHFTFPDTKQQYHAGYYVLYKSITVPGTDWTALQFRHKNPPLLVKELRHNQNYTMRLLANSFKAMGLVSDAFTVAIPEGMPSVAPTIAAHVVDLTWIYVNWIHNIPEEHYNGVLTGYCVRVDGALVVQKGLEESSHNETGLIPCTLYKVEVSGRTAAGCGKYATRYVKTGAAVPCSSPVFSVDVSNVTTLTIKLGQVPLGDRFDVIRGYHLRIYDNRTGELVRAMERCCSGDYEITGLEIFWPYTVEVAAFTSLGLGPWGKVIKRTAESVPVVAPYNVFGYNTSSSELRLFWDFNNTERGVLGILTGFNVTLRVYQWNDSPSNVYKVKIISGAETRSTAFGSLDAFRLYQIRVAGMTISGTGLFSDEGVDVRVEGKAPSKGPGIISSTTNSSITLELKPIEKGHWHAPEILDYYIELYLENQLIRAVHVPPNDPFINFNDLRIFTNYRVWPYARNVYGNGSKSNFWIRTDSIPPSREPTNLQCRATSSSSLLVSWAGLHDKYYIHGILQGYKVVIQGPDGSRNRSRVCETILVKNFTRLEFYTEYNVTVAAFNEKGDGPSADVMCTTDQDVPSVAPVILEAYNTSSSSIFVRWNNSIPAKEVNGILIGFTINATSLATGNSDIEETDHLISHTTIQFLGAYEVHRVHVSARTIKGDGVSAYIDVRTDEDVPEASPSISFIVVNQTSLQISWTELSQLQLNGVLLGYVIELYDGLNDTLLQATMVSCITSFTFRNLEIFWPYKVAMAAMTIKGPGVFGEKSQMTDESVPVVSPHGITGYNTSATSIKLHWAFNDTDRNVLGVLTGFVVHLKAANLDDEFLESEQTKRVIADPKAREYEVTALGIYTLYRFNMTATTSKGEGVVSLEEVLIRTNGKGPGADPVSRYTTNSTSISVDWDAIPREKLYGPLLGYKVGLYLVTESVEKANLINLAPNARNATFAGLRIFTRYKVIVYGFNEYGDGIQAAIDIRTDSERPSRPPTNLTCFNTSSTSLIVTWQPLSDSYYEHGDIQGYKVIANQTDGNSSFVIATCSSNRMLQFEDLFKYTEYNVTVAAFNEKGGGPSAEVMCTTDQDVPSAAPVQLEGYNISDTAIRVNWLPVPSANHHGVILGYKIHYSDNITSNRQSSTVDGGDVLTGDIQDLEPYTVYLVRVSAFTIKGQGPSGPLINVQTEERAPEVAPTNFVGRNTSAVSIELSWDAIPEKNVSGPIRLYRILYRKTSLLADEREVVEVPQVNNTVSLDGLSKYTGYSCWIQGVNKFAGIESPELMVFTDEDVPVVSPHGITGYNTSATSIKLHWAFNDTNRNVLGVLTGFVVHLKAASLDDEFLESEQTQRVVIADPKAREYEVTSLGIYTLYRLNMTATTSKGEGVVSLEEVLIRTNGKGPGTAPVTRYTTNSTSISVDWDAIPREKLYGPLLGYKVGLYLVTESVEKANLINFAPNARNATFAGLRIFTRYKVIVYGFNEYGDGTQAVLDIRTDSERPSRPPTYLTCFNTSSTSLNVTWQPLSDSYYEHGDIQGYKVITNQTDGNSSFVIATCSSNRMLQFKDLIKYTEYNVTVEAFNEKGGGPSAEVMCTTDQDVPSAAPVQVEGYNISDTAIRVNWLPVPSANQHGVILGYKIYYSDKITSNRQSSTVDGGDVLTGDIQDLEPYTVYLVRVSAFTIKGQGPSGPLINVKTEERAPEVAPTNFVGRNTSAVSIELSWDAIPEKNVSGPIRLYRILYRKTSLLADEREVVEVPQVNNTMSLDGLSKYTGYSCWIQGVNKFAGIESPELMVFTDEDVPVVSPHSITGYNTSATSIKLHWAFNDTDRNVLGVLTGFVVHLKAANLDDEFLESEQTKRVVIADPKAREYEVTSLGIYTLYRFNMTATTSKGEGVVSLEEVLIRTNGTEPGRVPDARYTTNSTSMSVDWDAIPREKLYGPLLGYKVELYFVTEDKSSPVEVNSGNGKLVDSRTVRSDKRNATFTELRIFTQYRVDVRGYNEFGHGEKHQLAIRTDSARPSRTPSNLTCYNTSSTSLRVAWQPLIDSYYEHGVVLGYNVTYKRADHRGELKSEKIELPVISLIWSLTSLEKFVEYNVTVAAFNEKGGGPSAEVMCTTDQDVPSAPPQLFAGNNISKSAINITWSPVPTDHQNGVILGYLIQYKESSSPESPWDIIQVNDSSAEVWTVDDLWPLTLYTMQVAAFTLKGVGPWTSEIEVTTDEAAPAYPPEDFRGHFASSVAVKLYWTPIPPETLRGALRLYRISYEAQGSLYISKLDVPPDQSEALVTGLNEFTEYRFWIQGVNRFEGNISSEIVIKTDEDVPDSIPSEDVVVRESTERTTDLIVQWEELTDDEKNGDLLGYKVYYKYNSMNSKESRKRRAISGEPLDGYEMVVVPPTQTSVTLSGLKKFSTYSVKVIGFTAKGNANISQDIVVSTPQDAPDGIPADLRVTNKSDPYWIPVWWGRIPIELINGILLGYRLYYKRVVTNGRPVDEPAMNLTFRTTEFSTTLVNLRKDSIYRVQVTAFTKVGEGPRAEVMAETCRCPPVFTTSWYNFPPYVNISETNLDGFLPQILADAIALCCSDCVNGFGTSRVDFLRDSAGNLAKKRNVVALTSSINYTDIAFPVPGYKGQTTYPPYIYVAIAKSPGVAYITVKELPGERGNVVQRMVFSCWPIFMLFLVTVIIAGVLIWVLERSVNPGEFPPSFITGVWNGVWWAFITMTTLGYGDHVARTIKGRIFTIAWTLFGLITMAILTGELATGLTSYTVKLSDGLIYGRQVGAIAFQAELRLGLRKGGKMNQIKNYTTYTELRDALLSREIYGALVDMYVVSSNKALFEHPLLRISKLLDYETTYGAVLTENVMDLDFCFLDYVNEQRANVYSTIADGIEVYKEPVTEDQTHSTDLFVTNTSAWSLSIIVLGSALGGLVLICVARDLCRRRTQTAVSIESVVFRKAQLKYEMDTVVKQFYIDFAEVMKVLSKRHRAERRQLVEKLNRERKDNPSWERLGNNKRILIINGI